MAMMMENFRPKKSREGFSLPQGGHHCSKNGDTWGGPDQLLFQKKKCICKKNWNGGKIYVQHLKGLFVIVNGWNDGWKMLLVHAILEKDNRKASDCLQE